VPLTTTPVAIRLTAEDEAALRRAGRWDTYRDREAALRDILFSWWADSHARD